MWESEGAVGRLPSQDQMVRREFSDFPLLYHSGLLRTDSVLYLA